MAKNKDIEYDYDSGLGFADFYSQKTALQKFFYNLKIFLTNDKEARSLVKAYNGSLSVKEKIKEASAKEAVRQEQKDKATKRAQEKQDKKDQKETNKILKKQRQQDIAYNRKHKKEIKDGTITERPVADKPKKQKNKPERQHRRAKPRAPHSLLFKILDFWRNKVPQFFANLFAPTVSYTNTITNDTPNPNPDVKKYNKGGGNLLLTNEDRTKEIIENIRSNTFTNDKELGIVELYEQRAPNSPKEDIIKFAVGAMLTGVVQMDTKAISDAIEYATGYSCAFNESEEQFEMTLNDNENVATVAIDAHGEIYVMTDNPQEDGQNVAIDIELALIKELGYIAENIPYLMIEEQVSSENLSVISDFAKENQMSKHWTDFIESTDRNLEGFPEHIYSINRAFMIMKTFYPDINPEVVMEYGFAKPMATIGKMEHPLDYSMVSGMQVLYGNTMRIKDAYQLSNLFVVERDGLATVIDHEKREVVTADVISKLKLEKTAEEIAETVSIYSHYPTTFEMKIAAHFTNSLLDEGKTIAETKEKVASASYTKEDITKAFIEAIDNSDKVNLTDASPLKSAAQILTANELLDIANSIPEDKREGFYEICKQLQGVETEKPEQFVAESVGDAVLNENNDITDTAMIDNDTATEKTENHDEASQDIF